MQCTEWKRSFRICWYWLALRSSMKLASLRMQFGVHYMRSSVILFRYNSYKPKRLLCIQFYGFYSKLQMNLIFWGSLLYIKQDSFITFSVMSQVLWFALWFFFMLCLTSWYVTFLTNFWRVLGLNFTGTPAFSYRIFIVFMLPIWRIVGMILWVGHDWHLSKPFLNTSLECYLYNSLLGMVYANLVLKCMVLKLYIRRSVT